MMKPDRPVQIGLGHEADLSPEMAEVCHANSEALEALLTMSTSGSTSSVRLACSEIGETGATAAGR